VPAVAGIDSSTQSVKVEVRDLDSGDVLAVGRGSHPSTTPPRSEQDPHSWWAALVEAFAQVSEVVDQIVAVSVGGQQHGLVVLDDNGDVIRPAKLWNDTESAGQADRLVEHLGAQAWADACGSVPVAAFTVTKLAWLAENEPESYARIASVMLPHDWLTWRLTGCRVTDRGDASGTGYYSASGGDWRLDLLGAVGPVHDWASILPEVLGPWESAGTVLGSVLSELGLRGDVVVGAGSGDNMAAALGMGLGPRDIALSFGTSGTAYGVSTTPTFDSSGCVAGFADATGNYLPLVCTLNATKVTTSVARLLGVDLPEFNRLALESPAGSGGLVMLPYFDGERTPNRPTATGLMSGLRSDVSREQMARASVEGVVCGLLDGVDALQAVGVPTDGRVLLLGGGAKSDAYRSVAAHLLGREVVIPDADEHVAAGMCLQAAIVVSGNRKCGEGWGLGSGTVVGGPGDVGDHGERQNQGGASSEEVRASYAALRG
jgi:xylulokinase